jgi:hypothetical protein
MAAHSKATGLPDLAGDQLNLELFWGRGRGSSVLFGLQIPIGGLELSWSWELNAPSVFGVSGLRIYPPCLGVMAICTYAPNSRTRSKRSPNLQCIFYTKVQVYLRALSRPACPGLPVSVSPFPKQSYTTDTQKTYDWSIVTSIFIFCNDPDDFDSLGTIAIA